MSFCRGFNLVELLVVLAAIVVLMALLAPGLEKATESAQVAFCASNEHAIGIGATAWLADHKQHFPQIKDFGTLLGNLGGSSQYNSDTTDEHQRPLNRYLGYKAGPIRVAQCPSDLGDVLSYDPIGPNNKTVYVATPNCYRGYGTSYQEAFDKSRWKIRPVFGRIGDAATPGTSSMKLTSMPRIDNKILLGDWPFSGDRTITSPMTRWHRDGERQHNILFADMHSEFFLFPHGEMDNPANRDCDGDPGWYWW